MTISKTDWPRLDKDFLTDWHEWDSVFVTGSVEGRFDCQPRSNEAIACACGLALQGWGDCLTGRRPPPNFGRGMVALMDWAGISAVDILPENAFGVAQRALDAIEAARSAGKA